MAHDFVQDCELLAEDLERLVKSYKSVVQLELGEEFPEDPKAQLWGAVGAVFNSWMNQRAKTYRRLGVDTEIYCTHTDTRIYINYCIDCEMVWDQLWFLGFGIYLRGEHWNIDWWGTQRYWAVAVR